MMMNDGGIFGAQFSLVQKLNLFISRSLGLVYQSCKSVFFLCALTLLLVLSLNYPSTCASARVA